MTRLKEGAALADHSEPAPKGFFNLPIALQVHILELAISPKDLFCNLRDASSAMGVCRAWRELVPAALECNTHSITLRPTYPSSAESSIASLLACFRRMTDLNLTFCTKLVGATLLHKLPSCIALEKLSLDFCEKLPTGALDTFAEACLVAGRPRIKHLSLASCPCAVGNGAFITKIPSLESLDVAWCHEFSPPTPGWLAALPNLTSLKVRGCDNLDLSEFYPQNTQENAQENLVNVENTEGNVGVEGEVIQVKEKKILQRLVKLDVAFIGRVNDDFLLHAVAKMPQLISLTLAKQTSNLWSSGMWSVSGLATLQRTRGDIFVDIVSS